MKHHKYQNTPGKPGPDRLDARSTKGLPQTADGKFRWPGIRVHRLRDDDWMDPQEMAVVYPVVRRQTQEDR